MSAIKDLPQFVRDLLASPPRAGEGVNLYLFRLARVLHPYRTEREIADILEAVTANCGRHRFRGGIGCEMAIDLQKLRNREEEYLRCEWGKRPSRRIIPEYRRWILSVWQRVSDETGFKTMEILQTEARLWEVWVFAPGEAPKKVEEITYPVRRRFSKE
jgi:hypothetical protein